MIQCLIQLASSQVKLAPTALQLGQIIVRTSQNKGLLTAIQTHKRLVPISLVNVHLPQVAQSTGLLIHRAGLLPDREALLE